MFKIVPNIVWSMFGKLRIGLTHIWRMDFPIIIIWVSPLSILGALGVNSTIYSIFRWNSSKQTE